MANLWHLEYIMWFLHYRSNFWVALSHYFGSLHFILMHCLWRLQDRTKLRISALQNICFPVLLAQGPWGLLLPMLWALSTEAGVAAGAQHLQKIAAPKRVWGETTARAGMSQAGFSLASLNTSRREDAKQVIAWMQDTIPGSQLPLKPMSSCLHCNWHLINTTSDMQSSLWFQCWLIRKLKWWEKPAPWTLPGSPPPLPVDRARFAQLVGFRVLSPGWTLSRMTTILDPSLTSFSRKTTEGLNAKIEVFFLGPIKCCLAS